jgi:hypothetical protein
VSKDLSKMETDIEVSEDKEASRHIVGATKNTCRIDEFAFEF